MSTMAADSVPALIEKHSDYVEVKPAEGKGLGLFATRKIPKGTRILEEQPLVVLRDAKHSEHLWKQFETMPELHLSKFCKLTFYDDIVTPDMKKKINARLSRKYAGSCIEKAVAEEAKMRAIFHTNSVAMGTSSEWGIGVFEYYSRINHSCTPNVHNSYNPTLRREVVHSVRDIARGEEILTSYTANVRDREDRQRHLRRYGFDCKCSACYGSDANSHEARRKQLSIIDQSLALMAMDGLSAMMLGSVIPTDEEALQLAKQNILLLREENILGMDLAIGYRDCSKLSLKQGDLKEALRYAQLEREVELNCLGTETEYMKNNDQYALTRIAELRSASDSRNILLDGGSEQQSTGQERQLSRNARRAQARAEARRAKAEAKAGKT